MALGARASIPAAELAGRLGCGSPPGPGDSAYVLLPPDVEVAVRPLAGPCRADNGSVASCRREDVSAEAAVQLGAALRSHIERERGIPPADAATLKPQTVDLTAMTPSAWAAGFSAPPCGGQLVARTPLQPHPGTVFVFARARDWESTPGRHVALGAGLLVFWPWLLSAAVTAPLHHALTSDAELRAGAEQRLHRSLVDRYLVVGATHAGRGEIRWIRTVRLAGENLRDETAVRTLVRRAFADDPARDD